MDNSNYLVFLRRQEVLSPIGWFQEERSKSVRLLVTVEATLKKFPDDSELENGLNYTDILDVVLRVSAVECRLLETLAGKISQEIYNLHPNLIAAISVIIEKPDVPHKGYKGEACGVRLDKKYHNA